MDKKINNIVKVFSENYGFINYEMVGIVDFSKLIKLLGQKDYLIWQDKYHYISYFESFFIEKFAESKLFPENNDLASYKVFVPIDDINQDWNPEYWYNKYPYIKKAKKQKLPITTSRKQVTVWKNHLQNIYLKDK